MRRTLLRLMIIVVACRALLPSTAWGGEEMKRVVVLGDSLSAAFGIPKERGWVSLLEERLNSAGQRYVVTNAGVSADTSAGGVSRVDTLLEERIDLFILELGANDALRGIDPEFTKENLREILRRVRKAWPQAKLVVAAVRLPPNLGAMYTDRHEALQREVAAEFDAVFLADLLEGVGGQDEMMLEDGLHPNVRGQARILENVWRKIQSLI